MILHATDAGSGPPVVLLHGLFGMARNLGFLSRVLRDRFRVIALDLRNHGDSPHAPDMRYATMAADVAETLDHLSIRKPAVIGHSMGGKTGMRLALSGGFDVGRLCIVDIAPTVYPPRNKPVIDALRSIRLVSGLTRQDADATLMASLSDPALRGFLLQNLIWGQNPRWRVDLDAIEAGLPDLEGWDAPPDSSWPGPTLFVAGGQSDFIRDEYRSAMRAHFPRSRVVTIRNAGHWVHVDNPNAFLGTVEVFLSGHGEVD